MPKAIQADWELIKALFLQGFTQSQIAQRTGIKPGTIHGRAQRYGWTTLRNKANGALMINPDSLAHQGLKTLSSAHSKALSEASHKAQQVLSDELHAQTTVLQARKPTKLLDLANTPAREGRASVVQKLVNTAAKLYGWDQQQGNAPAVNLTQVNIRPATDHDATVKIIDVPAD